MFEINEGSIYIDSEYCVDEDLSGKADGEEFIPEVLLHLLDTASLNREADRIRMADGKLPFFERNENGEWDDDGWYKFYVVLRGFGEKRYLDELSFFVDSYDDGGTYQIDLTDEEKRKVYEVLDTQLKERFDSSCEELLELASQDALDLADIRASNKPLCGNKTKEE